MANQDRAHTSMDQKNKQDVHAKGGKQSQASGHAHQFAGHQGQHEGQKSSHKAGEDRQRTADTGRKSGKH